MDRLGNNMKKPILGAMGTLMGSVGIALGQARLGTPYVTPHDNAHLTQPAIQAVQNLEPKLAPPAGPAKIDSVEMRLPPVLISTEPPPEIEPSAQFRSQPATIPPPTVSAPAAAPPATSAPTTPTPVTPTPAILAPMLPSSIAPTPATSAPTNQTHVNPSRPYTNGHQTPIAPPFAGNAPVFLTIDATPETIECIESSERTGSRLTAGGSLAILRPTTNNNTAYSTFVRTDNGAGAATGIESATEFHWNYRPSFAVWLGWENGAGWGLRTRYFRFDGASPTLFTDVSAVEAQAPPVGQGKQVNVPDFGLPGNAQGLQQFGSPGVLLSVAGLGRDQLAFASDLSIHSIPIEATYQIANGAWSFLFSGGGQYLNLDQGFRAELFNPGDLLVNQEAQLLTYRNRFQGWGPTMAAESAFQLGRTRLFMFGNARGSCLIGTADHDARFQQVVTGVNAQTTFTQRQASSTVVVPVTELELGLAYALSVRQSCTVLRAGVTNQTYFQTGSPTSERGNLNLFGLMLSTEVKF